MLARTYLNQLLRFAELLPRPGTPPDDLKKCQMKQTKQQREEQAEGWVVSLTGSSYTARSTKPAGFPEEALYVTPDDDRLFFTDRFAVPDPAVPCEAEPPAGRGGPVIPIWPVNKSDNADAFVGMLGRAP